MNTPAVSVCLPNLNMRPFLEERIATIHAQTFSDWELVVSDNYSDDGAWEYFQSVAADDPRVRISQAPREGMYANWNRCIRESQGEFVYIATSDDTMAPDCLEKMVAALRQRPDCGIAHCTLRRIDENGRDQNPHWWPTRSLFARSSGPLIDRSHVRLAPFDGLLHLLGDTVYTSLTQLLIRRSVFEQIGFFETRWGSVGDFNWVMRATLQTNTVHVPDTWGGWRVYSGQATAGAGIGSTDHVRKVDEMIAHALENSRSHLPPRVQRALPAWSPAARAMRQFFPQLQQCPNSRERRRYLVSRLLAGSWPARAYLGSKFPGRSPLPHHSPKIIAQWLHRAGVHPSLAPLDVALS